MASTATADAKKAAADAGAGAYASDGDGGGVTASGDGDDEGFKREMRDLEELLSKLNPMAEEFVPPSLAPGGQRLLSVSCSSLVGGRVGDGVPAFFPDAMIGYPSPNSGVAGGLWRRRNRHGPVLAQGQGRRRTNTRTSMAQQGEVILRTVYVADIDHQVTEEQLATLFFTCGPVVDCRMCGDPNCMLRFAFIEFTDEESARAALSLSGTVLGYYPVKVLPSKTAIAPVNPSYLPRSDDEREMCVRTVYCTNIDKKVTQEDMKLFFESLCGKVYRLRLLGDNHHATRIAFIEFLQAESATAALNCSGVVLGSLPIRVSPSKTPVRTRGTPRQTH